MPVKRSRAWSTFLALVFSLCLVAGCDGECEKESDCRSLSSGDSCPSDDDDDNSAADDDGGADDDSADDDDSVDDDDAADDNWNVDILYPELAWVKIDEGTYFMGCSVGDEDCNPDEQPSHEINVSGFMINDTEITQYQFKLEMGFNPSHFKLANGFDECPDCPVETVSWHEAKEFCQLVGGRLPTEAEWEYAARAETSTRFYCGDDWDCLDDIAWYSGNADEHPHVAKTKEANDYYLYDMLGNVWEWVNDWYLSEYYEFSPVNDPPGSEAGEFKVLRGGSWVNDPDAHMTASDRFLQIPESKYKYVGFRCIRQ